MSDEQTFGTSRKRRSLIEALNSGAPAPASSDEDCTVCDVIEQRLGRREPDCAPLQGLDAEDAPVLSYSARQGLGGDADFEPRLEPAASPDPLAPAGFDQDMSAADAPWNSTIGELNAALELAMSNLHEQTEPQNSAATQSDAQHSRDHAAGWPQLSEDAVPVAGAGAELSNGYSVPEELNQSAGDPNDEVRTMDGEPGLPAVGIEHQAPKSRRRRRFNLSGAAQLTGLALLILSLGLLPFAPSVLGALMPELATNAAPKERLRAPATALIVPPVGTPAISAEPQRDGASRAEPGAAPAEQQAAPQRPKAQRAELSVARIHRGQPGQALALPITAALPDSKPAGVFAAIRGLPAGASLSHGQALGTNLWTVPLDQLASLKVQIPAQAPDVSLITIEAFDADSNLLAQAASVIVVARAAATTAQPPVAQPPAPPAARSLAVTAPQEDRDGLWLVPNPSRAAGQIALMRSARYQQQPRGRELSWSNIAPRQNLVHVSLATEAGVGAAAAGQSAGPSWADIRRYISPAAIHSAKTDQRFETAAMPIAPVIPVRSIASLAAKPAPDTSRLVKRPAAREPAPPPIPAKDEKDDEDDEPPKPAIVQKVMVKRANRSVETPPAPASYKPRETKASGSGLGGPVPRRNQQATVPWAPKHQTSPETKIRIRQEIMDGSKGI